MFLLSINAIKLDSALFERVKSGGIRNDRITSIYVAECPIGDANTELVASLMRMLFISVRVVDINPRATDKISNWTKVNPVMVESYKREVDDYISTRA